MDRVQKAFEVVNRDNFLPENVRFSAQHDSPLPIGYGQTNSQPSTVRMMLEWLDVKPGNIVLDVGSGSGWSTALLAHIVGPKGFVYAVERVPELVKYGRFNCQKAGIKNVQFHQAGKKFGLPQFAPYDRILVSAAAAKLPKELIEQLKIGGKLVVPVRYDILVIDKTRDNAFDTTTQSGFIFVPLIAKK